MSMASVKLQSRRSLGSPLMIKDDIFVFSTNRLGSIDVYNISMALSNTSLEEVRVGEVNSVKEAQRLLQDGYSGTIRVLSEVDIITDDNIFNIDKTLDIIESGTLKYLISVGNIEDIIAYESKM